MRSWSESDTEAVVRYYTQDRDAGHEEPWSWGAERAIYSRQLQDANKRIHELEQELLKLREDLRKVMHAAAHPPQIEEEPVAFPARALRFSV